MSAIPTPDAPSGKKPISNLAQRVIFGLLGAVVLLGCVWYSAWTFAAFFAFVQARMLWEFYRMMQKAGYKPAALLGMGISILIFIALHFFYGVGYYGQLAQIPVGIDGIGNPPAAYTGEHWFVASMLINQRVILPLLLLLPVLLILREMYSWPRANAGLTPFANVGVALLGIFYVSIPMSLLNNLVFVGQAYDYRRLFALLLLVWASDIGAYAVGKSFGKYKLVPSISPGKTWEGAIGGFVLTLVVGWALGYLLPEMPLLHRLVAAGAVAVFGPLGDLAESMLKRSVNIKDSGRILPGHGGLLDRFDAFLFVVPVLVVVQLLFL